MGWGYAVKDLDGGRDISGEGKGPMHERYGGCFGVVEWTVGEYQSGDGVLHGRNDSFGIAGDSGRDDLHCPADP